MTNRANRPHLRLPRRQRGVSLAIAMVLLIGITTIALTSLQTGLLEMVMAGNEESRISAFQKAEAGIDAAKVVTTNFVIGTVVDHTNCTAGFASKYSDISCTESNIAYPANFTGTEDANDTEVVIRRLAPLFADCAPVRGIETDCASADFASFAVESRYRSSRPRGGRATVVQGYLVVVPSPTL